MVESTSPAELGAARLFLHLLTLAAVLTVAIVLQFSSIDFSFNSVDKIVPVLAACGAIFIYCQWRGLTALGRMVECCSIFVILGTPILVASYIAASFNMPLVDDLLKKSDEALYFPWREFVTLIDSWPLVATLLWYAYCSLLVQMLVLPIVLITLGKSDRAYLMLSSHGLMFLVICFASTWFPAVGAYPFNHVGPDSLHSIRPTFIYGFVQDLLAVRAQPHFSLSIVNATGIVSMPSGHAAGAFLCAWAAWDVKVLRIPALVLNALMAVAAISHGSHYLVDILAGGIVAALSIALASYISKSRAMFELAARMREMSSRLARSARWMPERAGSP